MYTVIYAKSLKFHFHAAFHCLLFVCTCVCVCLVNTCCFSVIVHDRSVVYDDVVSI